MSKPTQGKDYQGIISQQRRKLVPGQEILCGEIPHELLLRAEADILPENNLTVRFQITAVPQVHVISSLVNLLDDHDLCLVRNNLDDHDLCFHRNNLHYFQSLDLFNWYKVPSS